MRGTRGNTGYSLTHNLKREGDDVSDVYRVPFYRGRGYFKLRNELQPTFEG